MTDLTVETVFEIEPEAVERAKRVMFAMDLLKTNTPQSTIYRRLCSQFKCSRATAWRVIDVARDLL